MGITDFFADVWETFSHPSPDAEAKEDAAEEQNKGGDEDAEDEPEAEEEEEEEETVDPKETLEKGEFALVDGAGWMEGWMGCRAAGDSWIAGLLPREGL
jgi:hypothetical protein